MQVWKRILGERPIGLHDSFFDVGGNSFSLVSMHAALSEKYPDVLEVADIFANPTVAALKERIAASLGNAEEDLPRPLAFPKALLNTGGASMASETLVAELDAGTARRLAATARQFGVEPFELAAAMYGLYLNKALGASTFEIPMGFTPRPEYLLVEFDFNAVTGLRELAVAVREQHRSDAWATRRLVERNGAGTRRDEETHIRPLLLAAGEEGGRRFGFDVVFRLELGEQRLRLAVDYDGARLNRSGMQGLAGNYLKLIKALVGAGGSAEATAQKPVDDEGTVATRGE
jgi:hypothetical protein